MICGQCKQPILETFFFDESTDKRVHNGWVHADYKTYRHIITPIDETAGAPMPGTPAIDWRQKCLEYIDVNFAYEHLPIGLMHESSKACHDHALRVVELGTPNQMLYNSLDYLLLHKDAFVRSHLKGQP